MIKVILRNIGLANHYPLRIYQIWVMGDGYPAQVKLGMHGRDGRDTRSIPAMRKKSQLANNYGSQASDSDSLERQCRPRHHICPSFRLYKSGLFKGQKHTPFCFDYIYVKQPTTCYKPPIGKFDVCQRRNSELG